MLELTSLFLDPKGRPIVSIQEDIFIRFPSYKSGSFDTEQLVQELKEVVSTDYIDVKSQLQLWLRERHDDSGINAKLVTFLQKYYDWLYGEYGSEYILDDRFDRVKDIDECPDELIFYFLDLYAPGYKELAEDPKEILFFNQNNQIVNSVTEDSAKPFITNENIRDFLRGVKTKFYNFKGTDVSLAYFFITLLGAQSVSVDDGQGEYTLEITFQDNNPISTDDYLDSYLKLLHPVGMKLNIQPTFTNIDTTVSYLQGGGTAGGSGDTFLTAVPVRPPAQILGPGQGFYDGIIGSSGQEVSILGNYFPYTIGDTLDIAATAGCSGSTAHGITGGATGNTYTNMTTYAFPSWAEGIVAGTSFGLIDILDFSYLVAPSGGTSPNNGREDNHSCPVGGYA